MSEQIETNQDQQEFSNDISGRWVVGAIFGFALLLIAILFVYWIYHLGPFLPLQKAIDIEYPGSQPLVQGGQRKMNQNTPKILRVTMMVKFNPLENNKTSKKFVEGLKLFIIKHWKLSEYDELHIHLYKKNPEKKLQENAFEFETKDLDLSHEPA